MESKSITEEAEALDWSMGDYIIREVPGDRDGSPGSYIAFIRTHDGQYGRFHATASLIPSGYGPYLRWEYFVLFDEGRTQVQMCNDTEMRPRPNFVSLLKEVIPHVHGKPDYYL